MQKLKRGTLMLLVAILFAFGIYCGLHVARWTGFGSPSRIMSTPALLKQVQSLSDLVTVQYVIEQTEVWRDPPQNVLAQFVAGENQVLLVARGIVKAGVDFSQLSINDVQMQEKKSVVVTLPPARVTDAYLDDKETKVIERTTGFLRSFDKDLEQQIRRTAVDDIRLAALRSGIRKDADERARALLKTFLQELGFEKVEFRDRPLPP